jgi:ATP-dependent Zn protease
MTSYLKYLKDKIKEEDLYFENPFVYYPLIVFGMVLIVAGSLSNPTTTQSKFVKYDRIEDIDDRKIRVTVTFNNKEKKFDINSSNNYYINKNEKTLKIEYDPNNNDNFEYFSDKPIALLWILIVIGIIMLIIGLVSLWVNN